MIDIKNKKALPGSMIEIEGEIAYDVLAGYEERAVARILEEIELPGFRKGKVPEALMRTHVSDIGILEEMAEMALAEHYGALLEKEKIDAIGRPEITITKIARENPLAVRITTSVLPDFTLPDYKKIAKESEGEKVAVSVTDEEVANAIVQIKKMRAHQELHSHDTEDTVHEHHDHAELKEENLPELTDEYVKTLGNFADVAEFMVKLRENIALEKEHEVKEKNRIAVMEKLVAATDIDVPELLTSNETDKLVARMRADVAHMGMKFEDYLAHVQKTEEDMKKEMRPDGEKRAKLELIIDGISKKENIHADEKTVEDETRQLLSEYPDADPMRTKLYVEQVLISRGVMEFLDGLVK
jgi:FKBP-type peptidyl-prolyl cis-trans isomerase (trigger factor)